MSNYTEEIDSWNLATPPAVEPVSLEEFKLFARIDHEHEDTLLLKFLQSAREMAEIYTGRAFMTQEWVLLRTYIDTDMVEIPRPPLQAVTRVVRSYRDEVDQELDISACKAVTENEPGLFYIDPDIISSEGFICHKFYFTAGYGDAPESVPAVIKTAIMMLAGMVYEERIMPAKMPAECAALLDLYRVGRGE
ncbi:MAG: hypothetical protein GY757_09150 [bacterium]|nr:hypothetical protein [bacterium]